nr:NUDIX domain-containing protein [Paenibacillus oenotherae]
MDYVSRHSSRGVLINEDRQVAMMEMSSLNLYKLPGGGLEEGEDRESAFVRELREETGFDALILLELGYIDEHKYRNQYMQRSYCYIAKAASEQGTAVLTEDEIVLGMRLIWMSLEDAIVQMKYSIRHCDEYSEKFMLRRDLAILELAARLVDENVLTIIP